MHLTHVNMVLKQAIPSFLYRGKNRIVKKVTVPALKKRYRELERQEEVMLILRHPYLTVAQSKGHMYDIKEPHDHKEYHQNKRNEKFSKTFTWAEQLSHLRVKDAWD